MKITNIKGRQIIDSRGNPTVEVEIEIDGKYSGRASVPSGASTGTYEMLELRDNNPAIYMGESVLNAVNNVNTIIKDNILNKNDLSQDELDKILIQLDGTENKSNLGANAILGVSLAYAWATSKSRNIYLFEYIGELYGNSNFVMPRPMFNIMNGGKHANWATDIQEYMISPLKSNTWSKSLETGCKIFHTLKKLLKEKNLSVNVGDEGGFAPSLKSNEEALELIVESIKRSGYILGNEIGLGFDAAASEFYNESTKIYNLKRDAKSYTSKEMVDWIISLSEKYPVITFEDMLGQDDWDGWVDLTQRIGDKIQIVGDDLLVTNVKRVEKAIKLKACNSLLVKVNQIGTLSETLEAMSLSSKAGWKNVVSHRSGETEDVTIAHIVVGTGCGQVKTGSLSRGERTAKYNELLRIEEYLQSK